MKKDRIWFPLQFSSYIGHGRFSHHCSFIVSLIGCISIYVLLLMFNLGVNYARKETPIFYVNISFIYSSKINKGGHVWIMAKVLPFCFLCFFVSYKFNCFSFLGHGTNKVFCSLLVKEKDRAYYIIIHPFHIISWFHLWNMWVGTNQRN